MECSCCGNGSTKRHKIRKISRPYQTYIPEKLGYQTYSECFAGADPWNFRRRPGSGASLRYENLKRPTRSRSHNPPRRTQPMRIPEANRTPHGDDQSTLYARLDGDWGTPGSTRHTISADRTPCRTPSRNQTPQTSQHVSRSREPAPRPKMDSPQYAHVSWFNPSPHLDSRGSAPGFRKDSQSDSVYSQINSNDPLQDQTHSNDPDHRRDVTDTFFKEKGVRLAYVTDRILVLMANDNLDEANYEETVTSISETLKKRYGTNYKIINLSERSEKLSKFNKGVLELDWPSCVAPPLDSLCASCRILHAWLEAGPGRVVLVHCKGDLGRLATCFSAYICFFKTDENKSQHQERSILEEMALRRFYDDQLTKKITPSQRRYVQYFYGLLSGKIHLSPVSPSLYSVTLHNPINVKLNKQQVLVGTQGGSRFNLKIFQNFRLLHTTPFLYANRELNGDKIVFKLHPVLPLSGDILIICCHLQGHDTTRDSSTLFRLQVHSSVISEQSLSFCKEELDEACNDCHFSPNGVVVLRFVWNQPVIFSHSSNPTDPRRPHSNISMSSPPPETAPIGCIGFPWRAGSPRSNRPVSTRRKSDRKNAPIPIRPLSELKAEAKAQSERNNSSYRQSNSPTNDVAPSPVPGDLLKPGEVVHHTSGPVDGSPYALITRKGESMDTSREDKNGNEQERGEDSVDFSETTETTTRDQEMQQDSKAPNLKDKAVGSSENGGTPIDWKKAEMETPPPQLPPPRSGDSHQGTPNGTISRPTPSQREAIELDKLLEELTNMGKDASLTSAPSPSWRKPLSYRNRPPPRNNFFPEVSPTLDHGKNVGTDSNWLKAQQERVHEVTRDKKTRDIVDDVDSSYSSSRPTVTSSRLSADEISLARRSAWEREQPSPKEKVNRLGFQLDPSHLLPSKPVSHQSLNRDSHQYSSHERSGYQQGRYDPFSDTGDYESEQNPRITDGGESRLAHLETALQRSTTMPSSDTHGNIHGNGGGSAVVGHDQSYFQVGLYHQSGEPTRKSATSSWHQPPMVEESESLALKPIGVTGIHNLENTTKSLRAYPYNRSPSPLSRQQISPSYQSALRSSSLPPFHPSHPRYPPVSPTSPNSYRSSTQPPPNQHNYVPDVQHHHHSPNQPPSICFDPACIQRYQNEHNLKSSHSFPSPSLSPNQSTTQNYSAFPHSQTLMTHSDRYDSNTPPYVPNWSEERKVKSSMSMRQETYQKSRLEQKQQLDSGAYMSGEDDDINRYRHNRNALSEDRLTANKRADVNQFNVRDAPVMRSQPFTDDRSERDSISSSHLSYPQPWGIHMGSGGTPLGTPTPRNDQPITIYTVQGTAADDADDASLDRPSSLAMVKATTKIWYKPNFSREEAIELVKDSPAGTFVIRDSTSFPNSFGLAVKVEKIPEGIIPKSESELELVRHFLIEMSSQGVRIRGCPEEKHFPSLPALIDHHSREALALPCLLRIPELTPGNYRSPPPGSKLATFAGTTRGEMTTRGPTLDSISIPPPPSGPQRSPMDGQAGMKRSFDEDHFTLLYIGKAEVEWLTGQPALDRSLEMLRQYVHLVTETECGVKVAVDGITLTDKKRRYFFRHNFPWSYVSYVGAIGRGDKNKMWKSGELEARNITEATVVGFVARSPGTAAENMCYLFCDQLEKSSSADHLITSTRKYLKEPSSNNVML